MKRLKTLEQLYREEIFKYVESPNNPTLSMSDVIFPDGVFVELKNNLVVFIRDKEIQTIFPIPYSASIKGDYEEKLIAASDAVTLDYAISVNTEEVDFILDNLRSKPDVKKGALYLVLENQKLPSDSRFRSLKFLRTYPDLSYMTASERKNAVLLTDVDDRKALYSAYKKMRKRIIDHVTDWHNKYRDGAFDVLMYNKD